jgi:hypothetical protein
VEIIVVGGYVVSRTDGQVHWVRAIDLVNLYGLHPFVCSVLVSECAWLRRQDPNAVIVIGPRHDGRYKEVGRWLRARGKAEGWWRCGTTS